MPDERDAGTEILNLRAGLPAGPDRGLGSGDSEGPEGRGLREETGLAHRRGHRRAALLPPRGPGRARAATAEPALPTSGNGRLEDRAGFGLAPDAIRADLLHEAGAHAVQELGYRARRRRRAACVLDRGQAVDAAAREIEFVFAVGLELLLRDRQAARRPMLWAQAVAAFGPMRPGFLPNAAARADIALATRASTIRYTNLLRVTTEAHVGRDRRLRP